MPSIQHDSPGIAATDSRLRFRYRPSEDRGGADHGWLKTFHTFSFADYQDSTNQQFGSLRVLNEDRVAPATGFPFHQHREFEIASYLISGELSHKDSMGNVETMKRGDVQMTSGGTGIRHSEYNDHDSKEVHFLQIWASPSQRGLTPQYYARHFSDEEKLDKLCCIIAPVATQGVIDKREASGPTPIHASLNTFVSLLSPAMKLRHTVLSPLSGTGRSKLFYAQLVQTSGYNTNSAARDGTAPLIKISGGGQEVTLGEGDGVFISEARLGEVIELENVGGGRGELIMFETDKK